MFKFLKELFNLPMKKGGVNIITPEQRLNRPAPPKRITHRNVDHVHSTSYQDDGGDDLVNLIVAEEVISAISDFGSSYSDSSSSFTDFGGGDFGGGGSSGDW